MKFSHILLIIGVMALLGVAGLFLTPNELTTEEENHAIQNRKEIIKGLEGAEADTADIDKAIKDEREQKLKRDSLPAPTEIMEENESGRDAYIEYIHRVAPGTDWRGINEQVHESNYQQYANLRAFPTDSFANGKFKGWWEERGSKNNSGSIAVATLSVDGKSLYAGSAGGNVWKSKADGSNWRVLNDQLQFSGIKMLKTVLVNGKERIICVSSKKVMYSDNDGVTWTKASGASNIESWGDIQMAVMANNQRKSIYLLAHDFDYTAWKARTAIYISHNLGKSFTLDTFVYDIQNVLQTAQFSIWTDDYGSGQVYVLAKDQLLRTHPDTSKYNTLSNFNVSLSNVYLCGAEVGSGTKLYALFNAELYYSGDAGLTWARKGNLPALPFTRLSFATSHTDVSTVYLGSVDCYQSNDYGQTFLKIYQWQDYYGDIINQLHADIMSVQEFKDTTGTFFHLINCHGGTYTSADRLNSVQNISLNGLNVCQYYDVYTSKSDPNYIHVGSQDQGYQAGYQDPGGLLSFDQVISGDYGHICSGDSGKSIFMNYPGFTLIYPDVFVSKTKSKQVSFTSRGHLWIPPLCVNPDNPMQCWLGGGSDNSAESHLYEITYNKAQNKATSVELMFDFGKSSSDRISAISVAPPDHAYRYVMTDKGNFWHTGDGGKNWTVSNAFNAPAANYLYGASICPSPISLGQVFVGGSGYSGPAFWQSDDHGNSFKPHTSGLPQTMIYELAPTDDGKFIFAATDAGPYVFDVVDTTWFYIGAGRAADQTYWGVEYIPRTQTVRFATYGRGIWDLHIGAAPNTGIFKNNIAERLTIYPNPSSDFVTLNAVFTEKGLYTFDLIDLNGKLCKHLEQQLIPGESTVTLDVKALANGRYILNILLGESLLESKPIMVLH